MPKSKKQVETPSVQHFSADPFEISFILGGGNKDKFSELGVTVERNSLHQITFTAKDEDDFDPLYPLLKEILERYRRKTVRTIVVTPQQVAFIRGGKSVHLNRIKETSGVENVFFNDRDAKKEDGTTTKMVEIAVLGTIPCINKFMAEVLSSILSFQLRELKLEMPPRETKEEREERRSQRKDSEE